MKPIIIILFTIIYSSNINAEVISSSFGFTIDIPKTWTPLTGEEIKNNPDLFNMDKVKGLNPELLRTVKPMILAGKAEFFFLPDSTSGFADNVNVIKQIGRVPDSQRKIAPMCQSLPQQLSTMFKYPIRVYNCEIREVNKATVLYLEFDGAIPNSRSLQYHIPQSRNVYLIITATVKNKTYKKMGPQFHSVMKTFRAR